MGIKKIGTLEVSALALGCMGMSGFYGQAGKKQCVEAIRTALENGITFLDTADSYGFGNNEALIGNAIAPFHKHLCIATKVGVFRKKENPQAFSINGTPQYIKQQCLSSRKRLGVDVIDLYYLHHVDPNIPIEVSIQAMAKLVADGFVRHIGLCEMGVEHIRRAHAIHPITAIQAEYSPFSRNAEKELLPLCKELGIGFAACAPLCRGLLGGVISSSQNLASDDFRQYLPRFQSENLIHNLLIVSSLKSFANEKSCSLAQLSLAWAAAHSSSVVPLFGTTQAKHVLENIGSAEIHLSNQEIDKINEIVSEGIVSGDRHPDGAKHLYQAS